MMTIRQPLGKSFARICAALEPNCALTMVSKLDEWHESDALTSVSNAQDHDCVFYDRTN